MSFRARGVVGAYVANATNSGGIGKPRNHCTLPRPPFAGWTKQSARYKRAVFCYAHLAQFTHEHQYFSIRYLPIHRPRRPCWRRGVSCCPASVPWHRACVWLANHRGHPVRHHRRCRCWSVQRFACQRFGSRGRPHRHRAVADADPWIVRSVSSSDFDQRSPADCLWHAPCRCRGELPAQQRHQGPLGGYRCHSHLEAGPASSWS